MFPISASRDSSSPRIASFSPYCVPGAGRRARPGFHATRLAGTGPRRPAGGECRRAVFSAGRGHPEYSAGAGPGLETPARTDPFPAGEMAGGWGDDARAARGGTPWRIPRPVPGIEEFEEAAAGRAASRLVPRLAPAAPRAFTPPRRRPPPRLPAEEPASPPARPRGQRVDASWRRPIPPARTELDGPARELEGRLFGELPSLGPEGRAARGPTWPSTMAPPAARPTPPCAG